MIKYQNVKLHLVPISEHGSIEGPIIHSELLSPKTALIVTGDLYTGKTGKDGAYLSRVISREGAEAINQILETKVVSYAKFNPERRRVFILVEDFAENEGAQEVEPDTETTEEGDEATQDAGNTPSKALGLELLELPEEAVKNIREAGYMTLNEMAHLTVEELMEIPSVGPKTAEKIVLLIQTHSEKE